MARRCTSADTLVWSDLDCGTHNLHVAFETNPGYTKPQVHALLSFGLEGLKGEIMFEGQCYIQESQLPYKIGLVVSRFKKDVYIEEIDGTLWYCSDLLRKDRFLVEIWKAEKLKDTSQSWYDEEAGGDICLFPTGEHRLHFRVL